MSAVDQFSERPPTPKLKDMLGDALQAHQQVPQPLEGGAVQVPASVWLQIAEALERAKGLHDHDLSTARITNRESLEGEPHRDQLIEVFVPVREGSIGGIMGVVKPDQKGGPEARVSWPSIGSANTDLARKFALGIVAAAERVEAGLAQKLEEAPAANPPPKPRRSTRHA